MPQGITIRAASAKWPPYTMRIQFVPKSTVQSLADSIYDATVKHVTRYANVILLVCLSVCHTHELCQDGRMFRGSSNRGTVGDGGNF